MRVGRVAGSAKEEKIGGLGVWDGMERDGMERDGMEGRGVMYPAGTVSHVWVVNEWGGGRKKEKKR